MLRRLQSLLTGLLRSSRPFFKIPEISSIFFYSIMSFMALIRTESLLQDSQRHVRLHAQFMIGSRARRLLIYRFSLTVLVENSFRAFDSRNSQSSVVSCDLMFSPNLPVLLVKLLHEWGVELGVHGRKDTVIRDGTVKYLLDS